MKRIVSVLVLSLVSWAANAAGEWEFTIEPPTTWEDGAPLSLLHIVRYVLTCSGKEPITILPTLPSVPTVRNIYFENGTYTCTAFVRADDPTDDFPSERSADSAVVVVVESDEATPLPPVPPSTVRRPRQVALTARPL